MLLNAVALNADFSLLWARRHSSMYSRVEVGVRGRQGLRRMEDSQCGTTVTS